MSRDPLSRNGEPILDACLEEILGSVEPPDLTARILQDLAERHQADPIAPPVQLDPVQLRSTSGSSRRTAPARRRRRTTDALVIAAAAVIGIVSGSLALWQSLSSPTPSLVQQPPGENGVETPDRGVPTVRNDDARPPQPEPAGGSDAHPMPPRFDAAPPFPVDPDNRLASDSPKRRPVDPKTDTEVVAFINQAIRLSWDEHGAQQAEAAGDDAWCRRLYLRVLGRIPTVDELKAFQADTSPEKRTRLVDRLLDDEQYAAEYAQYWGAFWTNVLIGRRGGSGEDRAGLQRYLAEHFEKNTPYDQLAVRLISANGSSDVDQPDYDGAVHFLLASANEKSVLATSRTARVFLGQHLNCVQCHNHPNADITQNQFWELNAFFRQMRIERQGGQRRLVNRDFAGESGKSVDDAEVYFERPDGTLEAAYPAFPGRGPIGSTSGRVEDVDRRQLLAELVASSELLDRAAVNRIWGHFFGHGFTRPLDDMGPYNPASHPQLLDGLADQFAAHGRNFKSLLRWIVTSEPFGLSSRIDRDQVASSVDRPDAGTIPLFSRYYTRQLQPEAVFDSLQLVARAHSAEPAVRQQARRVWLEQFSREMGTDEGEEHNSFRGDVRQSLIIMNGPLMREAISLQPGTVLHKVLHSSMPLPRKLDHLFLAALARRPSQQEQQLIATMAAGKSTQEQAAALQDIWWALLNSNEFILDH